MMMKVAVPQRFKLRVVPDVKTLIFGSGREVHYIGGTEVLPPLEGMRESEMINRLGTEYAEDAKKVLIEHNLRLVVYIAKKFDNTGVGVEDLISIGTIGLIKAINTFNPTKKIKLATYASRCIENEILMYLRRNSKTKMEVSIDEPLNVDWDGNELLLSDILGTEEDTIYKDLENEAERKLLIRALNKLNSREKLIVSMRFGLDNPDGKEKTQMTKINSLFPIIDFPIIISEKVGYQKPQKEIFELIQENDSYYVGDGYEIDMMGAHQAGLKTIWYNHQKQEKDTSFIDFVVYSDEELLEVVKKLNND